MATLSSRLSPLTVSVPAMSDWTSYTPAISWTNTTQTGRWRRVGDSIQLLIDVAFTGSPAAITAIAPTELLNPIGVSIDSAKLPNTSDVRLAMGTWNALDTGTNGAFSGLLAYNGTAFESVYPTGATTATGISLSQPFTWVSGDNFSINVTIPITGWTSHVATTTGPNALVVGGQSVGSTLSFGATSNQGFNILANNAAAIASTAAGALTLGLTSKIGSSDYAGQAIVGRTNGVAISAGYVGESLAFTTRTTTGSTGSVVANTSALVTLTTGVWIVYARAFHAANNAASVVGAYVATNSTADFTGLVAEVNFAYNNVTGAANQNTAALAPMQVVNVSASQNLFAKSYSEDAAVNVEVRGFAVRIA